MLDAQKISLANPPQLWYTDNVINKSELFTKTQKEPPHGERPSLHEGVLCAGVLTVHAYVHQATYRCSDSQHLLRWTGGN